MDWPKEKIIQLIDLYHDQPLLWNPKHADYKDRNKKNDAWDYISTTINHDKGDVEKKMKNLTTQFYREQKKTKSGDGADDVIASKWFALKSMMFLKDKNKPNNTKEAGIRDYEDYSTTDTEENNKEPEKSGEESSGIESLLENTQEKLQPKKLFKSPNKLKEKQKRKNNNQMVEEAYQVMKTLTSKPEKDEYNIFGEHVSNKIRKLDTNYSKNTVQYLINNILYEAELGKYNEPPPNQSLYYNNYSSTIPGYYSHTSLLSDSNHSNSNLSSSETPFQPSPNNNNIPTNPSMDRKENSNISTFLTVPESSGNSLDTLLHY